jgi:prepilin-type N-terminal cleavage/methylation domain-containing protein
MTRRHQKGFSLLEIAVALGIVGILTAGALRLFTTYAEREQETSTARTIAQVEDALVLHAARTGRLPCPADSTPKADEAGREQSLGGGRCASGADMEGVPWRTLGIARDKIFDGWGNRITYAVDPSLTAFEALDMTGLNRGNGNNAGSGRNGNDSDDGGNGDDGNAADGCNQGNDKPVGNACNAPGNAGRDDDESDNGARGSNGQGQQNAGSRDDDDDDDDENGIGDEFASNGPSDGGGQSGNNGGASNGDGGDNGGGDTGQSVQDWLTGKGLEVRTDAGSRGFAFQSPAAGTGAAFVLVSHGPNGEGAFATAARVSDATNSSAAERENADGDSVFVDGERTMPGAETVFDDVVTSISVDALARKSGWYLSY